MIYTDKHKKEIECWEDALSFLKKSDYAISKFPYLFTACRVDRTNENDARPDIVLVDSNNVIGIEHFAVTQANKGSTKMKSVDMEKWAAIDNAYTQGHNMLLDGRGVPKPIMDNLMKNIVDLSEAWIRSSYADLIAHFEYGLSKHSENMDAYDKALDDVFGFDKKHKLGFLIDISCNFSNQFIVHGSEMTLISAHTRVVFKEYMQILKREHFPYPPSFVIFAFRDTLTRHVFDAVIVDPSEALANKSIVWLNCCSLPDNSFKMSIDHFDMGYNILVQDTFDLCGFLNNLSACLRLYRRNEPFVCDRQTAYLLYNFGNYIRIDVKRGKPKLVFKRKTPLSCYSKLNSHEFDNKYPILEANNDI